MSDRRQALADLQLSREMWLERGWNSYSYARIRQVADELVELTLLVVEDGRVVERSLSTSTTGEDGLGDRLAGKRGKAPRLVWRERGREVGKHEQGAPAVSLLQLYDLCRDRVLLARTEHAPQLSFHRDGLLQHCGFSSDDCSDCPAASMHAVSHWTAKPWQEPRHLLCTDRYGVFLPDQAPLTSGACEKCWCQASLVTDPNPAPAPVSPALAPAELELCRLEGDDCPEPEENVGNICKIDPAACPQGELLPDRANWMSMYLLSADCGGGFVRALPPECIALPRPTSWGEPYWRTRCRPTR